MPEDVELLPSFDRPPLGEVALLAQFEQLPALRNADYLRLWNQSEYKHLYPTIGEYLELPPFREDFDASKEPQPDRNQRLYGEFRPIARYNFRSNDRCEQIQIQRDRIGFYWQKGNDSYPRFQAVLEKFKRDYLIFQDFFKDRKWAVIPNQCAISYSNPIHKGEGWETPKDIQNVFTFWKNESSRALLPGMILEDFVGAQIFTVSDAGRRVARLHVTATIREPDEIVFDLIFRGPPHSPTLDGVVDFFKMGRKHIVTTFEALTTKKMHEMWGKR